MDESPNKKKHGRTTYKIVGKLAVELVTVIAGILIAFLSIVFRKKELTKKILMKPSMRFPWNSIRIETISKVNPIEFKDSGTRWNFMRKMLL